MLSSLCQPKMSRSEGKTGTHPLPPPPPTRAAHSIPAAHSTPAASPRSFATPTFSHCTGLGVGGGVGGAAPHLGFWELSFPSLQGTRRRRSSSTCLRPARSPPAPGATVAQCHCALQDRRGASGCGEGGGTGGEQHSSPPPPTHKPPGSSFVPPSVITGCRVPTRHGWVRFGGVSVPPWCCGWGGE